MTGCEVTKLQFRYDQTSFEKSEVKAAALLTKDSTYLSDSALAPDIFQKEIAVMTFQPADGTLLEVKKLEANIND